MNREIKFRAWNGECMMYRGLHDRNWYTEEKGGKVIQGVHPDDVRMPIMEFTGVEDSQGVNIYEGDYLQDERSHGDFSDDVAEVRFVDGKFCYPNYGALSDLSEINEYSKVIGNIYE